MQCVGGADHDEERRWCHVIVPETATFFVQDHHHCVILMRAEEARECRRCGFFVGAPAKALAAISCVVPVGSCTPVLSTIIDQVKRACRLYHRIPNPWARPDQNVVSRCRHCVRVVVSMPLAAGECPTRSATRYAAHSLAHTLQRGESRFFDWWPLCTTVTVLLFHQPRAVHAPDPNFVVLRPRAYGLRSVKSVKSVKSVEW